MGITIGSTNGEPFSQLAMIFVIFFALLAHTKEGKNNVLALGGNFVWVWLHFNPSVYHLLTGRLLWRGGFDDRESTSFS